MGDSNVFYMVYLEFGDSPSYKHPNLESAEKEARRLALTTKRKAFVLCTLKSIEVSQFTVTDCRPSGDDLPF